MQGYHAALHSYLARESGCNPDHRGAAATRLREKTLLPERETGFGPTDPAEEAKTKLSGCRQNTSECGIDGMSLASRATDWCKSRGRIPLTRLLHQSVAGLRSQDASGGWPWYESEVDVASPAAHFASPASAGTRTPLWAPWSALRHTRRAPRSARASANSTSRCACSAAGRQRSSPARAALRSPGSHAGPVDMPRSPTLPAGPGGCLYRRGARRLRAWNPRRECETIPQRVQRVPASRCPAPRVPRDAPAFANRHGRGFPAAVRSARSKVTRQPGPPA